MFIELNHTVVAAHDKIASAKFFARLFGLAFEEDAGGYFAPVRVNDARIAIHHYAFKVSEDEFDAIFKLTRQEPERRFLERRLKELGTTVSNQASAKRL